MQPRNDDANRGAAPSPYLRLMNRVRGTSRRILDRLRALYGLYPEAMPPAALQWIELLAKDGGVDRRCALRLSDKPGTVVVCLNPPPAEQLTATIRDQSACGLGLYFDKPVEVGWTLWVRPADAPATEEWTVVEVRHCGPTPRGWFVGCELVRLPEMK